MVNPLSNSGRIAPHRVLLSEYAASFIQDGDREINDSKKRRIIALQATLLMTCLKQLS
jgi:hypothetical protein